MQKQAAEIRYFLFSQAFADGLRITFAILLPAMAGYYFGFFLIGLTVSLGALCVSLADAPGPLLNKRNGMLVCILSVFIVSLVTSFARLNSFTLGFEIVLFCFFFSMFNAFGTRAAGVGTAALLVMILTMDDPVPTKDILPHSAMILAGGLWYFLVSIALSRLQPYRPGQRILGECVRELARYLSIKASFYEPKSDLANTYRKLVSQHIVVNEKQDAVRDILFKSRQIVNESTPTGRKLVFTFVETVDLFEDITATYYNYDNLRNRFASSHILADISKVIRTIAHELDLMGMAIQNDSGYRSYTDLDEELVFLKANIDSLGKTQNESHLILKKILVNLRRLVQKTKEVANYFAGKESLSKRELLDHSKFISHQSIDRKIFFNNLSLSSSVFRHSLRVSIACIAGYVITKFLAYGHHSYWVLMTTAFIMKPAFSLTRQRNIERILGTVLGGLIGVAILVFVHNKDLLFAIMVIFMLLNYSFMRINYLATVLFTTPFVLILFSFLGVGFADVARERVFDTLLGCVIAFTAGSFLFPSWEKDYLHNYVSKMLKANADYLDVIVKGLGGMQPDLTHYKLVRKEVYVASANLSAAFQRMLFEPKNKQQHGKKMQEFIVLNHILFSNIATVATNLLRREPRRHPQQLVSYAKRSREILCRQAGNNYKEVSVAQAEKEPEIINADDVLLKDQLEFIAGLCTDIEKNVISMNL
jgi:YccS/YhfK family integral membrane protein